MDDLVSDFFLRISETICLPSSFILRKSLDEGVDPTEWKLANVSAISKSGPRDNACNYRPVSLTAQACCNLLESILRDNIIRHLRDCNLIKSSQPGFVKNRSCLTNLLDFFSMSVIILTRVCLWMSSI